MTKIRTLAPAEAQKIAAGEVAERPANVIKELLENALDAGATEVNVSVEEGGRSEIRVVDNGCGMSPEDARLCIEHHATSKITSVDDLPSLTTFGFRGEALSSIAAVSRMKIATKEESAQAGFCLTIEAGTIGDESPVSLNRGTDITVGDLFYNVPARKKFLKTKETEWRAIVQLFQAFCLAYKEVTFTLTHEGRRIYTIPAANSLEDRIGQLGDLALKNNLRICQAHDDRHGLSLTVACTTPEYTRFDRSQIFCFVNKRWVKNYKLGQALIKAYQGMLQPQRYPAGVVLLTCDPALVDINIHPRKEEVHFAHPQSVTNLIEQTVKTALEESQKKLFRAARPVTPFQETERIQPTAPYREPFESFPERAPQRSSLAAPSPAKQEAFLKAVAPYFEETQPQPVAPDSNLSIVPELHYRLVGQVQSTYILIEVQESMIFIDQHAAHERSIYEQLASQFEKVEQVRLLFPQVVTLSRNDLDLFEPYLELLNSFGIEAQRIAQSEVVINATPLFVKNQPLDDCIKQAIAVLHEHQYLGPLELKKIMHERIHALLSCKAAIKAGEKLTDEAMHSLIKELYAGKNRLTCPHGRPTLWELKTTELEKKFKRDYRST